MSNADQSQYAEAVTTLSETELQDVVAVAEPPACLLGGWAVHLHVTDGFQEAHGRPYIGSRDIDLGVHIDSEWSGTELDEAPVAKTLERIESELGYHRGRFGFYQQFHRETGDRLTEDEARGQPPHNIFRVDIDIIPDTTALDEFQDAFGFRPPAEPLLAPVFRDGEGDALDKYVSWPAPEAALIAPAASLAAMKIRAFPERDKSHKQLKDLADLHALLWYTGDYGDMRSAVRDRVPDDDVDRFQQAVADTLYQQAGTLIGVDSTVVRQSIEQLFM
jgi:hypothetical protein